MQRVTRLLRVVALPLAFAGTFFDVQAAWADPQAPTAPRTAQLAGDDPPKAAAKSRVDRKPRADSASSEAEQPAGAAGSKPAANPLFDPAMFGRAGFDPATFWQRMFEPAAEEEEKTLAGIEVSLEEERRAGTAAANAFIDELRRKNIAVVSRGPEVAYLRRLVDLLRPQMTHKERYRRITIYVANTREIDARSFPGGTLVFYRGLLDSVGSEAALAVIVGHELSHLDHGHQLAPIKRTKLAEQTFSGARGFQPDQFFKAGAVLAAGFARPFRPEDEAEADRDGTTWAYRAGYDPRTLAELFRDLAEKKPNNNPQALPFFRTHPPHEARAEAILDLYDELQKAEPQDPLYIGRENLRLRTTRREKEFAE